MTNKPISLVTGGAGFIGSHVVDSLITLNHTVIVLDDLSGGYRENVNNKAIFIKGSIENVKLLKRLFKKYRIDYVYHLAAYAAEGLSHFIRNFNYTNNLIGSINLLNESVLNNVKHFTFTSSIAVYGANQTPMIETMEPQPEDPYGIAKYAFELDLKAAQHMFGLNYTIFRPHNVYGERQNIADPYRNVIGIFLNNILQNKPLPIFGDGSQTRAFSYITDVAPYVARAPETKAAVNQIFNIGSDKAYSVLQLAKTITSLMRKQPDILFLPPRKEVVHAFSNHKKITKAFHIKRVVPLEVGLTRMIMWVQKKGSMKPNIFKNIEIKRNLPPSWVKLTK